MTYRIDDLEVPEGDPFRHDALDRRQLVEFLSTLIKRLNGPFVIALDSPWGAGKTTLVKMLMEDLRTKGFQCTYFNAWKVDYVTDPLVALVSSIDKIQLGVDEAGVNFRKHLGSVKKVTSLVAKRGLMAAGKALTLGALDLEKEIEAAAAEFSGNAIGDIVDAFNRECEVLQRFREELKAAIDQLPLAGKETNLILFIDELDRCRPSFAIELLERIKHLFDIPNVIFVLSIDKQQLEASTAAVYGSAINAPEYLRRFIDLEFGIPLGNSKRFTGSLLTRFGLDPVFAERRASELAHDKSNFVDFFSLLAESMGLSLRARERCITRLRVVMDLTPPNHYLDPILVALLIVLRSNNANLFKQIVTGQAGSDQVMKYLYSLPGGKEFGSKRYGLIIEAYLMAVDPNDERASSRIRELEETSNNVSLSEQDRQKATQLLEMKRSIGGGMRMGIKLAPIAAKIDLAAMVRD